MHFLARFFQAIPLCIALSVSQASDVWSIKKINGLEYVPQKNVEAFYQLKKVPSMRPKSLTLKGKNREITFQANSRAANINGVVHWLCFPTVEQNGTFYVSRTDIAKTIEPALRPEAQIKLRPVRTIVLDPGHGGHDGGAHSRYAYEKNFNLDLARRVRDRLLKRGFRVLMTRNRDAFVPLEERARIANREKDAIFVSIHFNASDNRAAKGIEVFCTTPRGAPSTGYERLRSRDMANEKGNISDMESFALANAVHHAMVGRLGGEDRGVKRARFAVLRLTTLPSVLVEGAFLSNRHDARNVSSTAWRNRLADAIVDGISSYRLLSEYRIAPRVVNDYREMVRPDTPLDPASKKKLKLP